MYHCHTRFYLLGHTDRAFETIKSLTPPERFDYSFDESEALDPGTCAHADIIFAFVAGEDAEKTVRRLLENMRGSAQLILLTDERVFSLPPELLGRIYDIWKMPLSDEELSFRLLSWQRAYKARCDAWEDSNFLETALNNIPNLIWFKDKNGIHERVNDSFCKTVGKAREDIQGRGHAYIWDVEEDDPACIESERLVMESGKLYVSEETITTGDGERLLMTYKSPLYDLDGSVMGTVGVAMDITKEREYYKELLRQNEVLETIFTSFNCGIICHTLDDPEIIRINQAALDILGYSSEEEMIRDGFHVVARTAVKEDRERLRKLITSLKKPGDSVGAEYRVRHSDGRILHIMGNFKLVEEDGRLICQRFLLDFTEQKLREQAARMEIDRKHAELLHALSLDYSLVCTFNLDTGDGRVLRRGECQPGILKNMFDGELRLHECINAYINTCVYAEDRDGMRELFFNGELEKALKDSNIVFFNYRTLCCEEVKFYRLKAVRVGDWSGSRRVVLGFLNIDAETRARINKKKQLDDAISQAEVAERANRAKSAFLSNMSHDIRTPMNAIVGFTTLALTHLNQTEQVEEYLKKILTSGNHLVSLINDVLDMSRIESGKMQLDESLCHLSVILQGLRSIVQGDAAAKQQELIIDAVDVYDEDVYCDKLRLNQVLLNLLSNSIKYTGKGGTICMTITENPGAPEGFANYEFRISDTGMGMSEEFVKHIFEPFERERNSTISGIQGTGLGMSITKNIVEMMKGTIEVKSEQGVGSEFLVKLTFRLATEAKPVAIPHMKNLRALVIDDDASTCEFMTYMLERIGLRAEWTTDGSEAVKLAQQAVDNGDAYSVYFIDWLMPVMNGVEVSRAIRENIDEDVPIIVLSAYDWTDIEEEACQVGVTEFCSKPLFMSELRRKLKAVFSAQEQQGEEQATGSKEPLRSGRILLAEDNELNQEIAVTILEEAGFTTDTADNGRIAIDMLKAAGPGYYDLVLMDVQMPIMGGYDATREIRALPDAGLAAIPIIAMTANAFDEDRREALRAGMNGHVTKPIDVDKLFETLDEIMDANANI